MATISHPAGQRIGIVDEPSSEPHPIARQRFGHGRESRGCAGRDALAGLVVHPAEQNVRFGFGIGSFPHDLRDATAPSDLPPLSIDFVLERHQSAELPVLDGEVVETKRFALEGVELVWCLVSGALQHGPP
jgi:hypothetical protein